MFIRDENDRDERGRFSRRALLLGAAQIGGFSLLGWRLHQLQVVEGRRFALLADDNRINVQMLPPERGRILARGGEVVGFNVPHFRIVLVPALTSEPRNVLLRLSRILTLSAEERERLLARMRGQPKALPLVIASGVSYEQIAEINLLAPQLPGVRAEVSTRRQYRHGAVLGHALGHVGAPERIGLDDDPVLRLPDIRVGKSGVELAFDAHLRGHGGILRQEVDARGRIVRNLSESEPRKGADVVLSLDVAVQTRLMQRLARERRAAVVAIAVESGEVVALGSVPAYDPNDILAAGSALAKLQASQDDPLVNRAMQGLYPPGSTFKMVTALAGLASGVITPKERIECDGSVKLADQTFRCWKRGGHGDCDLHRGLRESCDVYFYETARRIGIDGIARMGRLLGLGEAYPGSIGPQRAGVMPDADWKRGRFGKPWFQGETLLAGIGQGYVLTTPLQLAVMTARLATGRAVMPILARGAHTNPPAEFSLLSISRAHLDVVRRAMVAVVNEGGGTGHNAQLDDGGEGRTVAGKTGTSQVTRAFTDRSQSDLKWEERDHALFVAYVPADKPRYAVAAVIEHGGGGGAAAAPLAKDVMEILLEANPAGTPFGPGGATISLDRQRRGRQG